MATTKTSHITRRSTSPAAPADSQGKRDVAKLTKAIVDGLEDVKAQNLMVFDTEHLSSLFERVIVASGTSNRQTKALSMSVREAVSEAGFPKPRTEGEDNGEWIIVDCGAAVVHIMQPAIRQYYHLEDIWGEKPMRTKHAAAEKEVEKRVLETVLKPKKPVAGKKSAQSAPKKEAAKKPAAKKQAAKKGAAKASPQAVAKKAAAKKVAAKAPPKKAAAKKSA
ncbi:MAG: ribosome silencing factor [Burkholderiales bacterium]|nr:MAG: ribosome silencing factor [Burkholderiales bacterium]